MNDEQVMHAVGIDDAYHVERVLASGAGGTTELVTLDGSGPFVRKRIPPKLACRGVWATIAECDCLRLPRVELTYEMPDEFVVVCDYVPGQTLGQLVSARGRLPEEEARGIVLELCEAAGALHAHGIVHRDIAPSNVVVAADGAHLIDLGIARFGSEGATHDTTQLGTPGFASPEQYGFAQTDARSDVYSLGRMLGYLLTGVTPGVPDVEEYERVLADEDVVSAQMRTIVCRASAMEPSARYQSAEEFARALRGGGTTDWVWVADAAADPETAQPVADKTASGQETRHRLPLRVVVGVVIVAVLVAATVLLTLGSGGLGGSQAATSDADAADTADATDPDVDSSGTVVENTSGTVVENATAELQIVDSGWSVDSNGDVSYAIAITNTGTTRVDYPGFTITGYDASGTVLFLEEQYLSSVAAGETIWWGDYLTGLEQVPARVEFAPLAVDDYQLNGSTEPSASFAVTDVNESVSAYGELVVTGSVAYEQASNAYYYDSVALVVVLRDEAGAITGGFVGVADLPDVGASTLFEVEFFSAPKHATFEVYALVW